MASNLARRVLTGEGGIDFVGRRRTWYSITAAILVACILGIALKGFSLGIDFEGGTKMNMPAGNLEPAQVSQVFEQATGVEPSLTQVVGSGDSRLMEINSQRLDQDQIDKAREALFEKFQPEGSNGKPTPDSIGDSTVSESWGSTITNRMLMSLGIFLVLIFGYITLRFERDMAIAAIAGLAVDGIVVAGIYAFIGFEVTPATVIGLLTVLAFSLYDTVVVFDKVKENTAGWEFTNRTYAEQANLAVNQTVMRSIATTVISALPIASLMVVAVWLMGVGTLKDLALVQMIGVIEGTFSSVFLATPILVSLKNRSKKVREHTEKVMREREGAAEEAVAESDAAVAVDSQAGPARRTVHVDQPQSAHTTGTTWRPGQ
ncbi:protein translocase subunit SecF [Corynebacterium aquilae]|uniref:Protein-export membrane protein SecF n=1 Tax=Corynebacterium aquilae DSM 44791 TaxID=1431546 RepID=A0A1L7CG84_9CORY|nr:protein translocase subunit SecF [Corynebacterium aquilae]APT84870.1 preprotein translocase subunit SecF [Corynebacterium aquilae DSM 44791]